MEFIDFLIKFKNLNFILSIGYFMNDTFYENLGKDFIDVVYDNLKNNERCDINFQRFYGVESQDFYFDYKNTPFSLKCCFQPHFNNKGYEFIHCKKDIYIYIHRQDQRVGILCTHTGLDSFYVLHSCLLIVRDIILMIETIEDESAIIKRLC